MSGAVLPARRDPPRDGQRVAFWIGRSDGRNRNARGGERLHEGTADAVGLRNFRVTWDDGRAVTYDLDRWHRTVFPAEVSS